MRAVFRSAWRFFLLVPVFFSSLLLFPQSAEIPYTGEEPPGKVTFLSRDSLPRIENPRLIPPRAAKSESEAESIRSSNEIWQNYQKDMEIYRKIKSLPGSFPADKIRERPASLFYTYTVKADPEKYLDTFNGLYARFQTGQGTLATVNRISSPGALEPGTVLILPVPQGLYIPKDAGSALELLLQKEYAPLITEKTGVYVIDGREFYFLPEKTFSPTQIAFFHDPGMKLPLDKKIVTSEFGYRTSPISGQWRLHAGIDLAAPTGTEVYACKSGSVETAGNDPVYGNYIDIRHSGNTISRYAHLSKILVRKGQSVSTGQTIGLVGTTGASTGPHLHFEVRENGKPTDPSKQIKNF